MLLHTTQWRSGSALSLCGNLKPLNGRGFNPLLDHYLFALSTTVSDSGALLAFLCFARFTRISSLRRENEYAANGHLTGSSTR
jgi:hypothetical protein